jgi:uncharacterized membrane-anchored protein YhcB (DUF1043 family)
VKWHVKTWVIIKGIAIGVWRWAVPAAAVLVAGLAVAVLITQILNQVREDQKRDEQTSAFRAEIRQQTEIINRQFQALCFLVIETSGTEALKQLDPPLEEQCRNLASELQEHGREDEVSNLAAPTTTEPIAPVPSNEAPAPTVQAPTTSSPPDPDEPTTEEPQTTSFVEGLLKSLGIR